jgi:hypothetical protein
MDRDIAALIVARATESARALATLPHPLKDAILPEEYGDIRRGIAELIYEIHEKLIDPVLLAHPDLREERERRMERFDTLF